jgi:hypothetical protein
MSDASRSVLRAAGRNLREEARKADQNAHATLVELEKTQNTAVRLTGELERYQRLAADLRGRAQELELDAGLTR